MRAVLCFSPWRSSPLLKLSAEKPRVCPSARLNTNLSTACLWIRSWTGNCHWYPITTKWCSSMCHYVTASSQLLKQFSHVMLWWRVDDRVRARSPFRVSLCTAFSKSSRKRSLQAQAVYKLLHKFWRVIVCYREESITINNIKSHFCIKDIT